MPSAVSSVVRLIVPECTLISMGALLGLGGVGTPSVVQGRVPALFNTHRAPTARPSLGLGDGSPLKHQGAFYSGSGDHFALPMTRACVISSLASDRKQDCNSRSTLRRAHRSSRVARFARSEEVRFMASIVLAAH